MLGHRLLPLKLGSIVAYIAAGIDNSNVATAARVSRLCIRKIQLSLEY
jgi:hypothetical protein